MTKSAGEADIMDLFSCLLRRERDRARGDPRQMEMLYQRILREIKKLNKVSGFKFPNQKT